MLFIDLLSQTNGLTYMPKVLLYHTYIHIILYYKTVM